MACVPLLLVYYFVVTPPSARVLLRGYAPLLLLCGLFAIAAGVLLRGYPLLLLRDYAPFS